MEYRMEDYSTLFEQVPEGQIAQIQGNKEDFTQFSTLVGRFGQTTQRLAITGYRNNNYYFFWIPQPSIEILKPSSDLVNRTSQDKPSNRINGASDSNQEPSTIIHKIQLTDLWETVGWVHNTFNITEDFILDNLTNVSSRSIDSQHLVYRISDVLRARLNHLAKPQVDRDSGVYVDNNKEVWAPAYWFSQTYNVYSSLTKPFLEKCCYIEGRDRINKGTSLYNISSFFELAGKLVELPQVDSKTNKIHQDGANWVTKGFVKNLIGIDYATIDTKLASGEIPSIDARGKNGHQITCYREEEVLKVFHEYTTLPKLNGEHEYQDENGELWITEDEIIRRYHIHIRGSVKRQKDVKSIKARLGLKQLGYLYNLRDFETKFSRTISLPRINKDDVYTDESQKNWVSAFYLANLFGLKVSSVQYQLKKVAELPTIKGKVGIGSGYPAILYDLEAARKVLEELMAESKKITNTVLPHQADEYFRNLLGE